MYITYFKTLILSKISFIFSLIRNFLEISYFSFCNCDYYILHYFMISSNSYIKSSILLLIFCIFTSFYYDLSYYFTSSLASSLF